jgi:hypothetical protein
MARQRRANQSRRREARHDRPRGRHANRVAAYPGPGNATVAVIQARARAIVRQAVLVMLRRRRAMLVRRIDRGP